MNSIELVIGFAGLHGAGKSTIAQRLATQYGFSTSSFGGVVRREALTRGLPLDLTTLQDLGAHFMEREWGQEKFCREVLAAREPKGGRVVVDGIRHIASLEHLRTLSAPGTFIFIYIDIDETVRLDRLHKRQRPGDMSETREAHPVEKDVVLLREHAHFIVDGGRDDAPEQILELCATIRS